MTVEERKASMEVADLHHLEQVQDNFSTSNDDSLSNVLGGLNERMIDVQTDQIFAIPVQQQESMQAPHGNLRQFDVNPSLFQFATLPNSGASDGDENINQYQHSLPSFKPEIADYGASSVYGSTPGSAAYGRNMLGGPNPNYGWTH